MNQDQDKNHDVDSPDFLVTPKRGQGVRRLNRLPLFVVAVLILLAVFGITYTFFSRQAGYETAETKGIPSVNSTATPPVRPPGNDYVPAAREALPPTQTGAMQAQTDLIPTETNAVRQPLPMSEAMQRRLRLIQQVEEKRLAKMDEALNGEGVVQTFDRHENATVGLNGGRQPNGQEPMPRSLADGEAGFWQPGGTGMAAENAQDRKRAFLAGTPEADIYLAKRREAALAPSQEVKAGTVIPGVMISGLNSDLPGQIIAQVREGVYDTATGMHLLVPPGARLIGTYDSTVTLGQQRALVAWNRIIYPDGSSISVDGMPGADQGGYAGFYDKVNNHYLRIFGNGLLLSVFSAGIQLSQPQTGKGENPSISQIMAGSLGQQMGQIGMQMAQRNMNIQPTLEIRPGYAFNVMVTKDIILPTWQGHPMAVGQR
ncbi:TrbI/VirB10 family protein [Xenorhabdus bovienii]|uniref:Conjugation TrbI family protein n=1 Tax=Xenorhabdus bovienii str. feltiae Moldova TaxID=1398200 RepID=A0A077NV75_XENBV|nr:TrbI/VirB10 family protein [Xenorhabdus bovienii]CDG90682.1 Conjugation TrbI family protein [Xenorhabdus bovienii str. feltiae Florida]CDH02258.1 Conjugation TrbI family protein [Xenorhabdus bovienii str. feltiae Moldova]